MPEVCNEMDALWLPRCGSVPALLSNCSVPAETAATFAASMSVSSWHCSEYIRLM